jgi:hypothetical protein
MNLRLIDDAKRVWSKFWSVRIALFFGCFNGALLGLAAFIDVVTPKTFLLLNVIGYGVVAVARVLKQPGFD